MTSDPAPSFGALLRSFRLAAGLTQEALAERAGLSARAVSSLEGGQRSAPYPDTVRRLDRALRLSAADRARLDAALPRRAVAVPSPPSPAPVPPPTLPAALTNFVGREQALAELTRRLGATRLLTLTGTGGVGKTRLAVEVVRAVQAQYPDGVWLVELAPLADPALVAQTVAAAVGVREQPGQPIVTTLVGALTSRHQLLLLDNCEHLLDASATLVEALLRGCPGVQVLATSRELLGVTGEVAWRVPSLATPDPAHLPPLAELGQVAAVRLFTERAWLVRPDFALTAENAVAMAQVCRRLDGIPLALELAAVRLTALTVKQIAARLDDRFRLLTGGRRTALRRQQTLAAALDWSHDLLTADERVLLRRLAVFAGGFTLEAAEAVGSGAGLDAVDVLDLLTRLVDKSLVMAEEQGEAARYLLLETVRQYAEDKLLAAGEAVAVRARHAAWFAALAHTLSQSDPETWYDRLETEYDNLRTALRWQVEVGDAEAGLLLCGSLIPFWYSRGFPGEGRAWLAELLALPAAGAPTVGRGRALVAAGRLAWHQDDPAAACAACEEAVAILRATGDAVWLTNALAELGRAMLVQRDYDAVYAVLEEAVAVGRACGETHATIRALEVRGQLAYYQREYALARALHEEVVALARAHDHPGELAAAPLNWLGHIAVAEGDYVAARVCYLESLAARQADPFFAVGLAFTLSGFSNLAAARGQHTRAARLAGAATRLCEADGVPPRRVQEAGIAARLDASRRALGESASAAAWAEGQALTRDEAVAEALADDKTD